MTLQNGTKQSVRDLVDVLNATPVDPERVEVVVAPPALHAGLVLPLLDRKIAVCAQNVSLTGTGAFTGEIAAEQLLGAFILSTSGSESVAHCGAEMTDFGISWTLVGHSERRAYYGESDEIAAKKAKRALDLGLQVIFCIGETLAEREAEQTLAVLTRQTKALADIITQADWSRVVIAYEPVWAIGTGVVATPAQAQDAHQNLRAWLAAEVSFAVADSVRLIYGGSVKADNAAELIALEDVDGFLVGGASLQPEFRSIVRSAL